MRTQSELDWTATNERAVDLAAYQKIYQEFGITAERVAAAARDSLARVSVLSA